MRTFCASILAAALAAGAFVHGYVVDPGGLRWGSGYAAFQSYFDNADAQRAVANAVREWQAPLAGIVQLGATGASGEAVSANGVNELAFEDLPPEVVSLTRVFSRSSRIIEADVAVARDGHDRAVWSMDEIVTHELGHALGLGHADDGGVTVRGAMAAFAENLTPTLSSDDLAGVVAAYRHNDLWATVTPDWRGQDVAFPPRNEPFAFRLQLETTYRDVLRRSAVTSFVDIEGTIVWTQEYLRYRVNGCSDQDAANRVVAQIVGGGIQPVCQDFTGTTVVFPPRNESFSFRQRLETVYRDTLRRSATSTFVDAEGDIVWTQEYLRYRVNGCNNAQATERVLAQVAGGAVQPVCTAQPTGPPITGFVTGVSVGNTPGTIQPGPRPAPGPGASVTVSGNSTVINGGANQVRLTASEPVSTVVVSVETTATGGAPPTLGTMAVTDQYYLVRLPAPATVIDLTLILPASVASSRFTIEYAVSRDGVTFGAYRPQVVQVTTVGTGDVQVSVTWNTDADVDLYVVEPNGTEIYYLNPRSNTGGELDLDSNAGCDLDNVRNENIRWPSGRAPSGTYVVRVNYWSSCGASSTAYTVRVINGSNSQTFTGTFTGAGSGGAAGAGREVTRFTR